MQRRKFVSHQTWTTYIVVNKRRPWPRPQSWGSAYLRNLSKLLAGEVDEGQVVEAGGDGGVVLDERAAVGVLGEEFVNPRVVAQ